MNLMGIDIGTTSVKSAVFNENLDVIHSSSEEYIIDSRGETVELDAEVYWNIVKNEIEKVQVRVDSIAIDTQCETLILADENGNPVRNAIVWLDNRASEEAEIINKHFGKRKVYEVTGQPEITAAWPACKLLWIKRHEPEVWAKTKKIFLLEDFILYRLTGEFVTERTLQSSSLYFDIRDGIWWKEMLDFIGIDVGMLPELKNSGELIGRYNGVMVCTGAMDQVSGAIGAGVVKEGIISEMTGTAMVIFMPCSEIPEYNEKSIVPCHYNYNGKYCLLSWTPTAGMALEWFKRNLCENYSFEELDKMAENVESGSCGLTFLPYLCGSTMPKYNPEARGSFTGISAEHTRAHFARSIMESVACILKSSLEYLGADAKEIRSIGGGAGSSIWCQIKADILGKKIVTLEKSEVACLGAAILAGVGTGVFKNVEAVAKKIKEKKVYMPSGKKDDSIYMRYCKAEMMLNKT